MASARASQLLYSRTLHWTARDSDQKASHGSAGFATGLRTLTPDYRGLRSLNKLDVLPARSRAKALPPIPRTSGAAGNSATIVCGINVVFVGAEAAPWSRTGGLAEVMRGLPEALATRGNRVMTVTPRYDQYKDAWDTNVLAEVKVGNEIQTVRYFHSNQAGVDRVFIDHPWFLAKVWGETGSKLYGPRPGEDYPDNDKRFCLLIQAALEAPRILSLNTGGNFSGPYGEDVVFVCNDWHTAILPVYLKTRYQANGMYKNAKSALCIHNISYQGRFPISEFSILGLPEQVKPSFHFVDGYDDPEGGDKVNWMRAGIQEADKVVTVSPYYAEEVVTSQFKGMELETDLRQKGVTGILNGINVQDWDPPTDPYIPRKYNIETVLEAKPLAKEALQKELGLKVDWNIPLIGFIGRLEEQKGSDILAASIPGFIEENVQVVALGTGKKKFEEQLQNMEKRFPNKVRALARYCARLAHMVTAGVDFILIPSRFEPAGLIQMQAMRYGTVPIVSSTGGLVNTVKEGYTGFQMGPFNVDATKVDPRDTAAIASTVRRAIGTYNTPTYTRMVKNCMSLDVSWKEPARRWEEMLMSLKAAAPAPAPGRYETAFGPATREVVTA